jgi:hypothetical protein
MDPKIIKVFNAFKTASALPILKLLCVGKDEVCKTDLDRRLTYSGSVGEKQGMLYSAKDTVVVAAGSADEFPKKVGQGKPINDITIDNIRLKALLDKTRRFCSKDNSRAVLNGILIETGLHSICATVTDGKRFYKECVEKVGVSGPKSNTVIMIDSNSYTVIDRMIGFTDSPTVASKIILYKESAAIRIGNFELAVKCIDSKQYPNTDTVLKTERACQMYEITGLPATVKFLKQFAIKEAGDLRKTLKLYAEKAVMNEGVYDKIRVREIKSAEDAAKIAKVRGADTSPCLITLAMAPESNDKARIVSFYLDYMKDVADVLGDHFYMYYNEQDGYGYFMASSGKNSKWM